jgi:hypothetical protein
MFRALQVKNPSELVILTWKTLAGKMWVWCRVTAGPSMTIRAADR